MGRAKRRPVRPGLGLVSSAYATRQLYCGLYCGHTLFLALASPLDTATATTSTRWARWHQVATIFYLSCLDLLHFLCTEELLALCVAILGIGIALAPPHLWLLELLMLGIGAATPRDLSSHHDHPCYCRCQQHLKCIYFTLEGSWDASCLRGAPKVCSLHSSTSLTPL
jgi:hypothetical protein